MALKAAYRVERGNTVPYPPLFDDVRRNHGFVDLRGRPELVSAVPEAAESSALRALLLEIAMPTSPLMSIGCDLGAQIRPYRRSSRRYWAGGYIQVALLPLTTSDRPRLHLVAKSAEARLAVDVANDIWNVVFALCTTHFKFGDLLETETLWIWFDAASTAPEAALLSRERLINSLALGLRAT